MKKENPNDPKTWKFELNINKHINKRTRIVICIVLIFLFILSIVGVLCFTKSLGSVEAAIRMSKEKIGALIVFEKEMNLTMVLLMETTYL